MSNALDRLNKIETDTDKPILSVEEQMQAVDELETPSNKEFFGGMSPEAKESMVNSFMMTEVKVEDCDDIDDDEEVKEEEAKEMTDIDPKDDEQFNNNTEEKKQRGRPKKDVDTNSSVDKGSAYDPIMNQLARDVLADLRKQKYSLGNFSASQTKLILDYINSKL
jgi:hypothetical protein